MPASLKINRNKRSHYTDSAIILMGSWSPDGAAGELIEIHVPAALWAQEWAKTTDAKMPGRPPKELLDFFQDRITAEVGSGNAPEKGVFTLRS